MNLYELYQQHLNELKRNFKTYGYPEKILEIGIQKPLNIPQTILLQSKAITIDHNNNLTFISTFNPNSPKAFNSIKTEVNNDKYRHKKHKII